jgi:radical SAM superfamily enzyme YgiQ (UPF0313 family)
MATVTVANFSFPFLEEDRSVKFLPLEALSAAAALEASGHRVDFRDYQQAATRYADPQAPENAPDFFAGAEERVLITAPHDALPVALLWARQLKSLDPRREIILGGYGPRRIGREILGAFPYIDAVVQGAVETTAPRLLASPRRDWPQVPGIAFRNGGIRENPGLPPASSLDDFPAPAYGMVDLNSYWEIMLLSASGCPFECCFCTRSGTLIEKSVERVIEELRLLRNQYGQKRVFFYDQTFTLKKERVLRLCQAMAETDLNDIEWSCTGRLNIVNDDMMRDMAAAGCQMIYFGVESGSDRVLQVMHKRIRRAQVEERIRHAQQYCGVCAFFIWGFPFESMQDFELTVDMISRLSERGVAPVVYVLSPLPGSPVNTQYRDELRFSREVWETNWPAPLSKAPSSDEVVRLIEDHPRIFPGFYSADPNITRKLRRIRELGWETHFPDA